MPVLEPVEFRLWTMIKGRAPWPEPNEPMINELATSWSGASREFAEAGSFGLGGLDDVWPDGAGGDFVDRARTDLDATYTAAEGMARQSDRATLFSDVVTTVKRDIRSLIETNEPRFLRNLALPPGVAEAAAETFAAAIAREVNRIVDDGARRIVSQSVPTAPIPPPPPSASPERNAEYWRSLTEEQRLRLARERPDLVGTRDGFSALHRDIANRELLDRARERLTAELAALDATRHGGPGAHIAERVADERRTALVNKLNGIDDIQRNLNLSTNDANGSRMYLLGFNPHEDGRAIVARGNPDTATHTATFVPGVGSDLRTIGNLMGNSDALHRAALPDPGEPGGAARDREQISVITWVDHDPPNGVLRGANPFPAAAATDDLDDFQHGLRAGHQGPESHYTVVGHSYGSTVVGAAANDEDLPIDDLVAVGSPGLGYDVSDASELNLPQENVWVGENRNDAVADSGALGSPWPGEPADPSDTAFGARVFRTEPDPDGPVDYLDFGAHDRYFREDIDNPGLTNMGDIIAGREPSRD